MEVVTPNIEKKAKFVKGMRYMINTATRDKNGKCPVFPYSQARIDRCPELREWFPTWPEDEPVDDGMELTPMGGGLEVPIEIAEVEVPVAAMTTPEEIQEEKVKEKPTAAEKMAKVRAARKKV